MNILDFGHGIVVRFKSIRPKQSATFHVTRKDMRKATGVTPETWDCINCGVNTAPRIPGRAETLRNIGRFGKSKSTYDLRTEVYTVHNAVWKQARMKPAGGCLCIGCLEKRLGRRLRERDFVFDHGFNGLPATKRLLHRRGDLRHWRYLFESRKKGRRP